ncbi:MAG: hypothetical protein ACYS47_17665, partial [Planctomycetota bacterium]
MTSVPCDVELDFERFPMIRWCIVVAAVLVLLGAPVQIRAEEEVQRVQVSLDWDDLPASAFRSLIGMYVRSSPEAPAPDGFDTLFEVRPEGVEEGPVVRILHKGWTPETVNLYFLPENGEPVEIPRLKKRVNPYYISFGPVRAGWMPFVTLHFNLSTRNLERWKQYPRKTLFLTPSECLAGRASIGGKTVRIGLLDRNLNGRFCDPCVKHARDGDWILVDESGDERFSITYSSPESRGITERVRIAGQTWSMNLRGTLLTLTKAPVDTVKIRFQGLGTPCTVFGWSRLTGSIQGTLDEAGCMEVPRGEWVPYSYNWTRGVWRITGSLRTLGVLKPPAEGPVPDVVLGPKLRCTLK